MRASILCVWLGAAMLTGCRMDPASASTPAVQRATRSHSTATVPPGEIQFEAGLDSNPGDGFDLPMGIRWGASPVTEFFVAPTVYRRTDTASNSGVGDIWAGVRHRLWNETSSSPAVLVEFFSKLPIADSNKGLGTGETDIFGAIALDRRYYDALYTLYGEVGFLGAPESTGTDLSVAGALSATRPWLRGLDIFAEVWGRYVSEREISELYASGGALYAYSPTTTIDLSLSVGLTDDADSLRLMLGFTRSLGRPRQRPSNP